MSSRIQLTARNDPKLRMDAKDKFEGVVQGTKHHGAGASFLGHTEKSRWEREREYSTTNKVKQDV